MANYSNKDYTFDGLNVQYGLGLAFNMAGKYPVVTKRIFPTLAQAQAFVDDKDDTAVEGLRISVTGDTTASNNGLYYVEKAGDGTNAGVLVRMATLAEVNAKGSSATTEIKAGTGISVTSSVATDGHTVYTIANDLDFKYVAATTGDNAKASHLDLIDKSDNTVIGSINVSDIIGNGMVKSHSYDKNTGILSIEFNTASGDTKVEEINLAELLDINDMSIADNSTNYLSVTFNGAASESGSTQAVFGAKIVEVSSATTENTGIADAYQVKKYVDAETAAREVAINELDVDETTLSATNISFKYSETDGKINISGLTVDYATVSRTNTDSTSGTPTSTAAITVTEGDESKLVKASDIKAVANYASDKAKEASDDIKKQISDLAIAAAGDAYITAGVDSSNNKKINVTADVQDVTGTKGTAGVYDTKGDQITAPTHGTLSGVTSALTDSAQSMSKVKDYVDGEVAIEAARSDAKTLASIKALNATVSADTTNVNVTVIETDGKLTSITVSEDYATVTRTAHKDAISENAFLNGVTGLFVAGANEYAAWTKYTDASNLEAGVTYYKVNKDYSSKAVEGVDYVLAGSEVQAAIAVDNGSQLATGTDVKAAADYAEDIVAEEQSRVDAKIAALSSTTTSTDAAVATVKVDTKAGVVTGVSVTNVSAGVATGGTGTTADPYTLSAATSTGAVVGSDIATIKTYVDNMVADATTDLSVSATGDTYVYAHIDSTDNKKVVVSAQTASVTVSAGTRGTWTVSDAGVATLADEVAPSISGTTNKLLDAANAMTAVKTYVDAAVAIEAAERAAKIESAIKALDVTEITQSGQFIVAVSETDGKISATTKVVGSDEVSATTVTSASTTIGLAGTTVKAQIEEIAQAIQTEKNNKQAYKLVSVTPSDSSVKEEFELHVAIAADGTFAKATDSANIKIYKDSSLVGISYVNKDNNNKEGQFIKYEYLDASGATQTTYIDLSEVIIKSEVGSGITANSDGVLIGVVDGDSEKFLTVGDTGFKLAGIQTAINAALTSGKTYTDNGIDALDVNEATVSATNVSFKYSETGGKVNISGLTVDYATISASTANTTSAQTNTITVTDGTKIATGNDVKTASDYAKSLSIEDRAYTDDKIATLDSTKTVTNTVAENGNDLTVSITEEDGVITGLTATLSHFDAGEW